MGRIRFTVLSEGHMRELAQCEVCFAVLAADENETIGDAIEQHLQWHYVMERTADEIKRELRELGL